MKLVVELTFSPDMPEVMTENWVASTDDPTDFAEFVGDILRDFLEGVAVTVITATENLYSATINDG